MRSKDQEVESGLGLKGTGPGSGPGPGVAYVSGTPGGNVTPGGARFCGTSSCRFPPAFMPRMPAGDKAHNERLWHRPTVAPRGLPL